MRSMAEVTHAIDAVCEEGASRMCGLRYGAQP